MCDVKITSKTGIWLKKGQNLGRFWPLWPLRPQIVNNCVVSNLMDKQEDVVEIW